LNDKFDLRLEEKDQLETFKTYKLKDSEARDFILRIFDNIDEEPLEKMITNLK
jgi:hypothetical protein